MTFPNDHRWPGELPTFKVGGHAFSDQGVAEDIAYEQGEDRSRQSWSFNAQLVSASTRLTQAQFDRFVAWYEDDLRAGTLRFDAQVAQQGGTQGAFTAWWEAQFVGPYRYQARSARYEVTAELLLLDGPYATRTAPSLRASTPGYHSVVAMPVVDTVLRASTPGSAGVEAIVLPPVLYANTPGSAEVVALLTDDAQGRLIEDGSQRLTESGDGRRTE